MKYNALQNLDQCRIRTSGFTLIIFILLFVGNTLNLKRTSSIESASWIRPLQERLSSSEEVFVPSEYLNATSHLHLDSEISSKIILPGNLSHLLQFCSHTTTTQRAHTILIELFRGSEAIHSWGYKDFVIATISAAMAKRTWAASL